MKKERRSMIIRYFSLLSFFTHLQKLRDDMKVEFETGNQSILPLRGEISKNVLIL